MIPPCSSFLLVFYFELTFLNYYLVGSSSQLGSVDCNGEASPRIEGGEYCIIASLYRAAAAHVAHYYLTTYVSVFFVHCYRCYL